MPLRSRKPLLMLFFDLTLLNYTPVRKATSHNEKNELFIDLQGDLTELFSSF